MLPILPAFMFAIAFFVTLTFFCAAKEQVGIRLVLAVLATLNFGLAVLHTLIYLNASLALGCLWRSYLLKGSNSFMSSDTTAAANAYLSSAFVPHSP